MIQHTCPSCQQTLAAPPQYAGKRVKCPKCGDSFQLPAAATEIHTATIPLEPVPPPRRPPLAQRAAPPLARPPRRPEDDEEDIPLVGRRQRLGRRRGYRGFHLGAGAIWGLAGGAAAFLLLVGAPVIWLNAGFTFITILLIILGAGFGIGLFPLTRWMSAERREGELGSQALLVYLFCLGFGLAFLAGGLTVHLVFAQATVYIDNNTKMDVRLELNGQPWRSAQPGATLQTALRRGKYNLVVRDASGQVLDEMPIVVEGPGNYVLNVLGGQVYTRGVAHYSTQGAPIPDTITLEHNKWFKADVDFLFQDAPSSISISHSRGQTTPSTASRTYLVRGVLQVAPNQMPPGQPPNQFPPKK